MSRLALGQALALATVGVLGVTALATGVTHRFFDYDEIYHAHATWLIARGDRPFHDFQASHTPFLWYPLAVVWAVLPDTPRGLVPLRSIAILGTLVSTAWLGATWRAVRRDLSWCALLCGIGLVALNRQVLDYVLEFRPDGWSSALLFAGFFLVVTGRPRHVFARCGLFGVLAGLAILASPKLIALPVAFVIFDLVDRWRDAGDARRALAAYTIGAISALALAVVFLRVARVDPKLAFDMAVAYQWDFERHGGFSRGLLSSVLTHPSLFALVTAGLAAWVWQLAADRRRPHPFETAMAMFLTVQLVIVGRPYKQYYGPWLLMAAFFVPFAGSLMARTRPAAARWTVGLAILLSGWTAWSAWRDFSTDDQAPRMLAFYDTLMRLTPPGSRIAGYPPLHPVVRRDVFYGWSRTIDPAGGFGTEAIMRDLAVPGYSERFSRAGYRQELAEHPPAIVVSPLQDEWAYEPGQWAALREFLQARRDEYVLIDRGLLRALWVRREDADPNVLKQLSDHPTPVP